MGYHLNRLDEAVFMAVSKPLLTEFGIPLGLESCVATSLILFSFARSLFVKMTLPGDIVLACMSLCSLFPREMTQ